MQYWRDLARSGDLAKVGIYAVEAYGIFKVRPFMCVRVYFSGSELRCPDYYTSHPPFDSASNVAIAAVGTVSLAIEYGEVSISACSGMSMNLI